MLRFSSQLLTHTHLAPQHLSVLLSFSPLMCNFLIAACQGAPGPVPAPSAGLVIRVNQLGYLPDAPKVAVVCALAPRVIASFRVLDARNRTVFGPRAADAAGPFGPCAGTYRLDFSTLRRAGVYRIVAGGATSLPVRIADDI